MKSIESRNPELLKSMTEVQIDKLVEDQIQSLINLKKSIIEDMKTNPEKFK